VGARAVYRGGHRKRAGLPAAGRGRRRGDVRGSGPPVEPVGVEGCPPAQRLRPDRSGGHRHVRGRRNSAEDRREHRSGPAAGGPPRADRRPRRPSRSGRGARRAAPRRRSRARLSPPARSRGGTLRARSVRRGGRGRAG